MFAPPLSLWLTLCGAARMLRILFGLSSALESREQGIWVFTELRTIGDAFEVSPRLLKARLLRPFASIRNVHLVQGDPDTKNMMKVLDRCAQSSFFCVAVFL
jgi:hypothetical protein